MAERRTLTVSITPELRAFVAGRLASGRYNNASEVIRAALRLLERDEIHSATQPNIAAKASNDGG